VVVVVVERPTLTDTSEVFGCEFQPTHVGKVEGTEIRLRPSAHFSGDTDKTVKPRGFDVDVDVTPRDFTTYHR
jgi:hypothetical protein